MRSLDLFAICLSVGPLLEVTARFKLGNVCRLQDLPELHLRDFMISGPAFPIVLRKCIIDAIKSRYRIGYRIYQLVKLSTIVHGKNTCLGTAILHVPVTYSIGLTLKEGNLNKLLDIAQILRQASKLVEHITTVDDSIYLYKAIRLVIPTYVKGGNPLPDLPNVLDQDFDVKLRKWNITLWYLLERCSRIDLVCREVVNNYYLTYTCYKVMKNLEDKSWNLDKVILIAQLALLSVCEDTLIIRKFNLELARNVSFLAQRLLREVLHSDNMDVLTQIDGELRSRGINPGSTADVIALALSLLVLEKVVSKIMSRRGGAAGI